MTTEKIARQGLTVRHVGVVVTMALTLLTAVGIVFTAAGLCYRPVSQHFGVQTSQVSLYITFVYLGQCIGAAPMAKLFDRFNAKTVCVVAALMVVIPYMGFCVYPAIWCYWVAGFIIGLGLVCVEFTMTAGILSRWFHTNYGTVTGIVFAMTGVGGVVWNIIGQFVLGPDLQGWRTLYMVFGVAIAIGTIPFIAIFVKRTPQECGTLPYGMPLDAAAMEAELAEEADKKAKAAGAEYTTKDYKDILADKDIDAVIICSSTDTHSPISIEAIKAGKHVFCEKPIDHDVDKIKEVIKTLEGTGLKYQVGFNRRFDHNFEAAQRAVVNGKIGAPHIIKITSRDPEPPSAEYVKVSGGMFLDMTIHDFDMVRFLAGCDAEEVYVQAANLVDPEIGKAGDVDTAIITLKMENGALAVIDNSRQAVYGYDQRAEVFGSKGMVAIKNDSDSTAVISNEDGVTGEKPQFFFLERYMDAYGKEMVQFIDAIENDTETPLGVEDGLKPVLMGLAAKKSVEEGRPVKISEIEF